MYYALGGVFGIPSHGSFRGRVGTRAAMVFFVEFCIKTRREACVRWEAVVIEEILRSAKYLI